MELMRSSTIDVDQKPNSQQQSQEHQEQHFHVLAVDDSLLDRTLLKRLLKASSYKGKA